jgi:glucosamine--fructose-6-phosphate aminotransferase (isomerizing)
MFEPDIPRPKARANEPSSDTPDDRPRFERSQRTYAEAVKQGEVMRATLSSQKEKVAAIAHRLAPRKFRRILIVGCGDSWFSAIGVRLAFEQLLGIPTEALQALEFALYHAPAVNQEDLLIGISSGGNTPAVIKALNAAKERKAFTIGVSNTENTPALNDYDEGIYVPATRKGWPTQASTSAMAVLLQLAASLAREKSSCSPDVINQFDAEFSRLPTLIDQVNQVADQKMKDLANEMVEVRFLFFSAGGPHFAAAAFGAAKVKELCPIHADTIPLEEFHHYRTLKPGDPLFLIVPDQLSHARAVDTAEVGRYDGGRIFALVPEGEEQISSVAHWVLRLPPVHDWLAPILYSVPLHLFAYHLAMAKFDKKLGFVPAFPR